MVEILNTLEGFKISFNDKSKRIIDIKIQDQIIEKLIFPFNKFDITALEYKPFTRFTLAKSLDDLTKNKFSKLINTILKNRDSGCIILRTNNKNKKINDEFLVKLSTAVCYLIGIILGFGFWGPWLAFGLHLTCFAAFVFWRFKKGYWKTIIV